MNKFLAGSLGGFVATLPMTIVMVALHRQLPGHERHPLPPEETTVQIAQNLGIKNQFDDIEQEMATWPAHFGFGAGAGLLYPLIEQIVPTPPSAQKAAPAMTGALFGLFVWAVSYLGWLPATGILNQPKQQPARPNLIMILAHLVWGVSLGILTEKWRDDSTSAS